MCQCGCRYRARNGDEWRCAMCGGTCEPAIPQWHREAELFNDLFGSGKNVAESEAENGEPGILAAGNDQIGEKSPENKPILRLF